MGTPEFARRPLEYLCGNTGHDILAVVTAPDKPAGRGLKLISTPVKASAIKLGLPIMAPDSLKSPEFLKKIKGYEADIYVVVAFRILPEVLYTIPSRGSINLHGSLLPKYRGAAPINWVLINGETETGITTFFLKNKVDTGDIIYQEKISIGQDEIFDELYQRMSERAGPVIKKTLDMIESGGIPSRPQNNSEATPAPKLTPEACLIDWGFPAPNVVNFIRGLSSIPGAYTIFRSKKIKVFRAQQYDSGQTGGYEPGQVIKEKDKLLIAVANGAVEITELLPEGKSRMSGDAFVRGYRPDDREMFCARLKGELD